MFGDTDGELSTDRLVLEPLRLSHADEMVRVLGDTSLYEFTGGRPPSRDELADRYRRQVEGSGRHGERWFNWIVRRHDTAEAVGYVQAIVTGGRADLAWLIGVDHQRTGFAYEASEAMVVYLGGIGVLHFSAHIAVDHIGSARVAERLGMQRTGSIDEDGEEVWLRSSRPMA
jgi:RimJ/RimL family protein N-acetyltransferase